MKGSDDTALNVILLILFSWLWVPVLLIGLVGGGLIALGDAAVQRIRQVRQTAWVDTERQRIIAERDDSFARIEAIGYEAEVRMLQAARGELDAIGDRRHLELER